MRAGHSPNGPARCCIARLGPVPARLGPVPARLGPVPALTRLKQDDAKISLRNRRNTAGWDQRYLAKLLFEPPPPKTVEIAS
jgi:hypothetical protein